MANAKEIKERMASIEETRKITNAMYLISSSKMKQAKKKLADTEPFFYAMQAEIARILRHVPEMHSQFFDGRESIPAEDRKLLMKQIEKYVLPFPYREVPYMSFWTVQYN